MKRSLDNLRDYLDRRGVSLGEFVKLAAAFGFLLGIVGILIYGAIGALLI
tara:strand:- start:2355 stop:2504 length:150 start_codon:yes stop_codon:yes gene_type:complete